MENINLIPLNEAQQKSICGKEAITIGLVAAILAIGILTIAIWKFYVTNKGKVILPGGFQFEWQQVKSLMRSLPL